MPYKPPMPDEDIEAFAAELRPLWRKGKAVRPWLRKHAPQLIERVRDEWTWACVGRALTLAGITYRTNRPWDGEHLRSQIARATAPLKASRAVSVISQPAEIKPPQPMTRPAPALQASLGAERLSDQEHERLDAKYGYTARVERRAMELRENEMRPWTEEELEEWRVYEADRQRFHRFKPVSRLPQQDEFQKHARAQVLQEDNQRRYEETRMRR
jgi:hypothetical protein